MQIVNLNSAIQQTKQLNGYWLLSCSLAEPLALNNGLDKEFYFPSYPKQTLRLFQANSRNNSYQFLCSQTFSEKFCANPENLQTDSDELLELPSDNRSCLMLGADLAMANVFALAQLCRQQESCKALLSSHKSFPFMVKPARFLMEQTPAVAIGASTLLEDWKIPNRLASQQSLPGCLDGNLVELFSFWLEAMAYTQVDTPPNWQIMIFADNETKKQCAQLCKDVNWVELLNA